MFERLVRILNFFQEFSTGVYTYHKAELPYKNLVLLTSRLRVQQRKHMILESPIRSKEDGGVSYAYW